MKKVLLPILMLIAIAGLLAVESAPSAIVGYVKYPCLTGNNLIALPMESGVLTSSGIGAANINFSSLSTWEADQYWNASTAYDDGEGGFIWDPDFTYTTGTGLLAIATADFDFYSMGTIPTPPVYPLVIGNNMITVPLNRSDLADTWMLGATSLDFASISLWDAVNQAWNASVAYDDGEGGFVWDPVLSTPIGTPAMVYSNAALSWPSAKGVSNSLRSSKVTK